MPVKTVVLAILLGGVLAACGSDPARIDSRPKEGLKPEKAAGTAAQSNTPLVLGGGGFSADGVTVAFSAERSEAEAALGKVLGEPQARDENGECGPGPMQFTSYPGGLTANFQQDRLVGWFFRDANPKIALENGITVGTPQERIAASPQFLLIEDSTLDGEFALGEAVGGFLAGDKVESLYAGVNCFFR
jgi:hypothetical protein